MSKNILFYCLLILSFIAFCAGAFYETNIEGSGKTQLMELLSSYYVSENIPSLIQLFLSRIKSTFLTWFFLLICPLVPLFAIMSPLFLISKGFSLGFSATMIIENFGYSGTLYIISSILPQGTLQLPILCLLTIFSLELSVYFLKFYTQASQRKKNKKVLLISARHYILIFILGFIGLTISCLIEVFLTQFLL